jgi:hypothetical protein
MGTSPLGIVEGEIMSNTYTLFLLLVGLIAQLFYIATLLKGYLRAIQHNTEVIRDATRSSDVFIQAIVEDTQKIRLLTQNGVNERVREAQRP